MTAVQRRHMLRMQRAIAQLRMAVVVLLAGIALVEDQRYLLSDWTVTALAAVALVYAVVLAVAQPYRRVPLIWWDVATGFIDWGLITAWILATGGIQSQFYLLYFLSVLSIAMRYGLAEVMLAGAGTALGYFLIALFNLHNSAVALDEAALRMGHLLLFAFGSGLLAREMSRHFRARLKEEAQRLAVQEVTATVSHDLKNPLNAIAGLIEMLLESAPETLPFEQRALLHRIDANAQQMMNLIANVLDAELIEHGRQQFQPTRVDVNALVRRVVEAQAHQAEVKHLGLVLNLSPHLPPALLDGPLIERLVANLLNNALKFTPEDGAVRVSTELRGARIRIEVWDSGPDVPASLRAALFEKFARQEDSRGIGLGLYICKSIVDMHQGEISVHNIGDGVSFVAELPVMTPVASKAQPAADAEVNSYTLRRTQFDAAASR